MIKCQICQHENPEGAEYCEDCGASLAVSTPAAAAPSSSPATPDAQPASAASTATPVVEPGAADATMPDAPPATGMQTAPLPPGTEPTAPDVLASTPEAPAQPATPDAQLSAPAAPAAADVGTDANATATIPPPPASPVTGTGASTSTSAGTGTGTGTGQNPRLIAIRHGAPTGDELPLMGSRMVVGRFDPETGPVDLDLSQAPESGQISRHHAEIYREADGIWHVKDLGSTNGVFVKSAGNATFGPRITTPRPLTSGDEVAFGNARFIFQMD